MMSVLENNKIQIMWLKKLHNVLVCVLTSWFFFKIILIVKVIWEREKKILYLPIFLPQDFGEISWSYYSKIFVSGRSFMFPRLYLFRNTFSLFLISVGPCKTELIQKCRSALTSLNAKRLIKVLQTGSE